MAYRLVEVELSKPLPTLLLASGENGFGIILRLHGQLVGFKLVPLPGATTLSSERLAAIVNTETATAVLAVKLDNEFRRAQPVLNIAERPRLSVVICTKDRAVRLQRLLSSLEQLAPDARFSKVDVIVVDNASEDGATRDVVATFPAVEYRYEPKAGLNFARNTALRAATGDLIAYLDDDVVVDRDWLSGLADTWQSCPDAGGFTGLVLPYKLDTEAQVLFESRGGFGRGFRRLEYRQVRHGNPLFPVGAGMLGAGCNMTFDRRLLIELGCFDEALDTGRPLPGGGDLDIFYRVLRSGRTMVYGPRYAVYHEHRETIEQLRRQYWSWGLGMMAFLVKCVRSDPSLNSIHRRMVRWWFLDQLKSLAKAIKHMRPRDIGFVLAELWGGVQGLCGEYDRSQVRIEAIRSAQPCP
ncbi:MAG: glycosyltransferase [Spongiibacteraceae bacterium]